MADSPLISRRAFLATGAVVVTGAVASPALLPDTTNELEVAERPLALPGLPAPLEGFRIAQVTDVHLYDGHHLMAIRTLETLERLRPDLIVVTGDMWDTEAGNDATPDWLRAIPAGIPSVAILGNHDYAHLPRGVRPWTAYERGEVPLLRNESLLIERGGATLAVLGLDDLRHGNPDATAAMRGVPAGATECWLIHEPGTLRHVRWPHHASPRFALLGHTHGGQIRLPALPAYTPQGSGGYVAGAYDVRGVQAYVSRGIGTSGPRIRVRCPAELPVFTLTAG